MLCPCQSHLDYTDCCQPLHLAQTTAQTAEQLMRSRYSAFVLQHIDYIIVTTAPAQQHLLDHTALLDWSKNTDWQGLDVIKHQANIDKNHSLVEFKAYFQQDSERCVHHELSAFVLIDSKWYFLDPTLPSVRTMKQPCFCGSSKKFKLCCGRYLN